MREATHEHLCLSRHSKHAVWLNVPEHCCCDADLSEFSQPCSSSRPVTPTPIACSMSCRPTPFQRSVHCSLNSSAGTRTLSGKLLSGTDMTLVQMQPGCMLQPASLACSLKPAAPSNKPHEGPPAVPPQYLRNGGNRLACTGAPLRPAGFTCTSSGSRDWLRHIATGCMRPPRGLAPPSGPQAP